MAVVCADTADTPDVLVPLCGVPVLVRSVRALLASGVVGHVVVLVGRGSAAAAEYLLAGLPVTVHAGPRDEAVGVVERIGAHARQRAGTGPGDGRSGDLPVLLHDAARPLAPPALAGAVAAVVAAGRAVAVPVLPLPDTVKRLDGRAVVVGTPDRTGLRVVQTPQAVRADLVPAVLTAGVGADRAWTVAGVPAVTVPGDPLAFPVRSPWDRELASVLLGELLEDR